MATPIIPLEVIKQQTNLITLRPKSPRRAPRARISYMNAEQIEAFLCAAREHSTRSFCMFLFALSHGARASEIANLRISDLNFKTGQVRIERLKGSLSSVQDFMKVKGNRLFDEALAFKTWLAERKPDADEYVFNSQKSTRLNRVTIYKIYRAIAQNAGLPSDLQHPHCLKHSCAMQLVSAGVNAFLVKQHLGHRSFDSTIQYVNPSDKDASAAAAKAFSVAF